MKKKLLVVFCTCLLLFSCAQIQSRSLILKPFKKSSSFILLPFENYTETPLAGLRVSSIAYGVLVSKGYNVIKYGLEEDKDLTSKDIKTLMEKAKNLGYKYAITGTVNEFRYKPGIDGEPVVSITLIIYDLNKEKPIYIATGAHSGWTYESVGITAQKILKEIVP